MVRRYTLNVSAAAPVPQRFGDELNAEQLAVVTAGDGPILVLAGAGTGKTRALTYRVAYLLSRGVPADAILLLTFTNKAARTMLQRAADVAGVAAKSLRGGTFHSVGLEVLRQHGARLGYASGFTVLDREDANDLMHAALVDAGVDPKVRRFPKPEVLAEIYSAAVNTRTAIAELIARDYPQFQELSAQVIEVLKRYVERKRQSSVMDFDDLLLQWHRLFVEHPEVREQVSARYRYVLVDEYQDTNGLQGEICDLIAQVHDNLLVVGDDAQSIYGFRGARRENILEFSDTHKGARIYKLETNYRSAPPILRLANATLRRARRGYDKTLRAVREGALRPALVHTRDEEQQAQFIAQRILELRDEGVSLDEIAVLYRAHYQSLALQIELGRRNIPFVVRSGIKFFESAHVKDVLAMLRALENPRDEMAFLRLLRMLPGVGTQTAQALFSELARVLERGGDAIDAALEAAVPKKAREAFSRWFLLYRALRSASLAVATERFISEFYGAFLDASYEHAAQRKEDLGRLVDYASQFETREQLLAEVALVSELASENVRSGAARDEAVVLSTVHQAKGLEWRAVFVAWLADGRFPAQACLAAPEGEEEERRLFYVAVTRAKDELYLCVPMIGFDKNRRQLLLPPSRFLTEIAAASVEETPYEAWQLEEAAVHTLPALVEATSDKARFK